MGRGHWASTRVDVNAQRGGHRGVANNLKFRGGAAVHDATLAASEGALTADNRGLIALDEPGSSGVVA